MSVAVEVAPGAGAEAEVRDIKLEDLGVEVEAPRYVILSFYSVVLVDNDSFIS